MPPARRQRPEAKPDRQIVPIGVLALDQIDLPRPVPILELLFAQDRSFHIAEHLVADETADAVAASETAGNALTMFVESLHYVGSDADIKRTSWLACKDIDARAALERHGLTRAENWTLKQVQGDEKSKVIAKASHAVPVSISALATKEG